MTQPVLTEEQVYEMADQFKAISDLVEGLEIDYENPRDVKLMTAKALASKARNRIMMYGFRDPVKLGI